MPAPPAPPRTFTEILEQVWWRLDGALDLEMIRWSAMLGALEALEAGTTGIVDHHESPNTIEGSLSVIADACAEVGVRVVCAYGVTDRHGPDGARRGLAENDRFLREGGRGLVGVHAAFTCSDETLAAAAALARDCGVGVHVHVAEDAVDGEAAARLVPLATADWVLAHCVHLDDGAGLAGTIVHNASSNLNNGVGYARPARFTNPVALGTDGIGGAMVDEFRVAFLASREHDVTATPDAVWSWLEAGRALVPETAGDRVTWSYEPMDPWRLAYTPAVHAVDVVVDGETVLRDGRATARRRGRGAREGPRAGGAAVEPAVSAEQTGGRVALYLQDAHPIREGMALVRYAEERGFEAVWQAESRLVREATVPMAAFLSVTERITVGSGVVNNWTRNPALLASTFSTLDDLAPGRVVLGIGAWWDPLAAKVGIDRARPLTAIRETIGAVRALLADENVTFDGEFVHLDGVELDYVNQPRRAKDVPIYLGATGMKMMELAGEICDGALLNYLVTPAYNDRALEHLEIGAKRAGRSLDDVDRPQLVVCSLDDDRAAALDAARLLVTQYLGQQPHLMAASGVPQALLDEIGEVLTWPATHDQVVAASRLVPDDVVQSLTASGTPVECRAKVAEYMASGCTCPVLYPLGSDVRRMIDEFAGWDPAS